MTENKLGFFYQKFKKKNFLNGFDFDFNMGGK